MHFFVWSLQYVYQEMTHTLQYHHHKYHNKKQSS